MTDIIMDDQEMKGFRKGLDYCVKWGKEHQGEVGVAEIALGAGIISWGLQTGLIEIGKDVVGSQLAEISGSVSAGLGAAGAPIIASTILKSVFIGGVACVQGVTLVPAIPAIVLVGGGALIFGAFGYTAGGIAENFFEPSFGDYVDDASIVGVGLALIIDGARRIAKDERILAMASQFKDGVISLAPATAEIVVKTWEELQAVIKEFGEVPESGIITGGTAVAGAAIGGSLAAGTVTILGSHGLGAIALSLGLVSAPVWPVIAGGAAGLAVGFSAWKAITYVKTRNGKPDTTNQFS